jgi:hypothetical protein
MREIGPARAFFRCRAAKGFARGEKSNQKRTQRLKFVRAAWAAESSPAASSSPSASTGNYNMHAAFQTTAAAGSEDNYGLARSLSRFS